MGKLAERKWTRDQYGVWRLAVEDMMVQLRHIDHKEWHACVIAADVGMKWVDGETPADALTEFAFNGGVSGDQHLALMREAAKLR